MKYKNRQPIGIVLLSLLVGLFPVPSSASEEPGERTPETVQALVAEAQRMAEKWAERIRGWSDSGEHPTTYLGVVIEPVPEVLRDYVDLPDGVGLLLRRIASDSPAERGGLKDNDILLSFDGQVMINYD
ncbi:MAG: PDZ domain-containing protein, partial [Oceanipulchritudo sp.]